MEERSVERWGMAGDSVIIEGGGDVDLYTP